MLDRDSLEKLIEAARNLEEGFAALPAYEAVIPGGERIAEVARPPSSA